MKEVLAMTRQLGRRFDSCAPVALPLNWLKIAAEMPGRTLHTAIMLVWLLQMRGTPEVVVGRSSMARFGVSRDAVGDGLRRLEAARLIQVRRQRGMRSVVTLLTAEGGPLVV